MIGMDTILLLSLIIMRVSGFILFNPIFGRNNIPAVIKAGIILMLSFVILSYQPNAPVEAESVIMYAVLLLKEALCGFTIGVVMNFVLYIIMLAGWVMDMQMGLSMSTIYDANSNISLSLSSSFFNALFILLFFTSNGHLAMIRLFLDSGQIVPYGSLTLTQTLSSGVLTVFCDCTVLAVKLAMPVLAAELLIEIAIGIMMKAIPQINVFIVNIQAKVMVGFILLIVMFTPMSEFITNSITLMFDYIGEILSLM